MAEPDITPQADYVYKINGKLDPALCENLNDRDLDPDRTEALQRQKEAEQERAAEEAAAEAEAAGNSQ